MTQITETLQSETRDDEPLLRVEKLACARGRRRLFNGFRLTAGPGEAVRIAGENGRGKTTLLRTVVGLQRPAAGRVFWRGEDVHNGEGYAGELLYLAHENALNPDLTPLENLTALNSLHAGNGDVEGALDALGIAGARRRLCRTLSAGQRRRVALARLHLSTSPLWLLDEPAAALDVAGRACLGAMIAAHVHAGGLVLFTAHEPLDLPDINAQVATLDS